MFAKNIRCEQSTQGALGVWLFNGVIFCFTLCPDAADPKKWQVPAGSYVMRRYSGTKVPNTFIMVRPGTDNIDGHTVIEIHPGNDENDTTACTILGETTGKLKGQRAVLNSGATFARFIEYTKSVDEFPLEIFDAY